MPEEDDDALGEMLGDRLEGTRDTDQAESESDDSQYTTSTGSTDAAESTQITQSTPTTDTTSGTQETNEKDTARSRSPFPLYITPDLKDGVQNRFEKFNAERTLNDEPKVEKHRHFMQGLLRAGLDHPDLEKYILDEFEDR